MIGRIDSSGWDLFIATFFERVLVDMRRSLEEVVPIGAAGGDIFADEVVSHQVSWPNLPRALRIGFACTTCN